MSENGRKKPKPNSLAKPMPDPIDGLNDGSIDIGLRLKRGSGFTHKRLNTALLLGKLENVFRGITLPNSTKKAA